MDEVQVDVEQVGQALGARDDVALPDLVEERRDPCFDASADLASGARRLCGFAASGLRLSDGGPGRDRPTRRCAATSACSATCSAGCSSSRRTRSLLDDVERVRALARAARGRRAAGRPRTRRSRRSRSSGRRASCARSRSTSSSRTSPSSSTASAAGARTRSRSGCRAESLDESFARLEDVPPRRSQRPASRSSSCSPRIRRRRRGGRCSRRTCASAALLAELDDPLLAPRAAARSRPSSPTRSRRSGRRTRCGRERPRVVDEIRNGHWFFEQSLIDAAERLLADYRAHAARTRRRRFASAPGSAATPTATRTRAPRRSARRSNVRGRCCASRYRDEVRALAAAIGVSSRSSRSIDGAARVDRARRARAAGVRARDRRPEPRRAVPPEALVHVAPPRRGRVRVGRRARGGSRAARPQPAREPRRADRRRRARRAAAARGALRPAPREARRARACARPRRSRASACAGIVRRGRGGAEAARSAGARHGDRVRHDVGGGRPARARADASEPLSLVPLFESVDALRAAPRIYEELLDDAPAAAR